MLWPSLKFMSGGLDMNTGEISVVVRARRRLSREAGKFFARFVVCYYWIFNRYSRRNIVMEGGPTVSLTTHGKRANTVFCTIESIGRGSCMAGRVVLWLDDLRILENLPDSLKRLQRRGLEILLSENFGPHTKYFPMLEAGNLPEVLVTADDDILYPKYWLSKLKMENRCSPDAIVCYRAHRVDVSEAGIGPYNAWKPCRTQEASFLNFATGVSGVIYPRRFLECLKAEGKGFRDCAPKADDVWLYVMAMRNGFKVRQINRRPIHFLTHPASQDVALHNENGIRGGNDFQIERTCTDNDVDFLRSIGG